MRAADHVCRRIGASATDASVIEQRLTSDRIHDYMVLRAMLSAILAHRLINSGGGSTPKTHVNKEVKGDRRVLVLWTRTEQPGEIAKRRQSLVSKKRGSHAYFSSELTT
jgi:hypothetical protein